MLRSSSAKQSKMRPSGILFCAIAFRGGPGFERRKKHSGISSDPRSTARKSKESRKNSSRIKKNMPNHYEILGLDVTVGKLDDCVYSYKKKT